MMQDSLATLQKKLKTKTISSVELTQYFLNRIQKWNPELNAFITVTEDIALRDAQCADSIRAQGKAGPLTGLPIAHKDIFCTDGILTTCASKILSNFVAPYDATVVSKLKQAGMVLLGKTNMDEFAMGSSNETSFYGPVCNPWNADTVPGGSSGGSAAAVAAGLAPIATGTDTGGSIRQPAAFCGLTGLKPTYGCVSRYGMIAFASSLDQGGLIAKSAEDIALVLEAMAGFDEKDSTSVRQSVPDYRAALNSTIKGKRIGLPKEFFEAGLDTRVGTVISDAVQVFQNLGAEIQEVSLPHMKLSVPVYYVIAPAECSSNLARYDGVRFGYRSERAHHLYDLYFWTRQEGFGAEVKRRIMIGTYVLSSGYYDAYYVKAQKVRRLIKQDFDRVFKEVDILIGPTTPTPAFRFGEKTGDPIQMYLSDIYTIAVNLAGLPGISIPVGLVDNLPVGLQMITHHFTESALLNAAHQYQQVTHWHQLSPREFSL